MDARQRMQQIDQLFSHVWMVRTFLKHSDEADDEPELQEVHRTLYDIMLSLGGPLNSDDAEGYLRQARKKLGKLRRTAALFQEVQPEISTHTNFQMAARSLTLAVQQIEQLLLDDATAQQA